MLRLSDDLCLLVTNVIYVLQIFIGIICQGAFILLDPSTGTVPAGTAGPYLELRHCGLRIFNWKVRSFCAMFMEGTPKCVLLDDIFSGFYLSLYYQF